MTKLPIQHSILGHHRPAKVVFGDPSSPHQNFLDPRMIVHGRIQTISSGRGSVLNQQRISRRAVQSPLKAFRGVKVSELLKKPIVTCDLPEGWKSGHL